mgnify:CR=1 FL=1
MYFSTGRMRTSALRHIVQARRHALLLALPMCVALGLPLSAVAAPAQPAEATGTMAVASVSKARPTPQAILDGADTQSAATTAQPAPATISSANAPRSTNDDPVLKLLADRGLLPTPVSSLAGQVKDKASDLAAELVISAMEFLGVPYRLGGNSAEEGFDCSGFTRHVFENSLGLILPRRAAEQAHAPELVNVDRSELKPGDLVFFNTLRRTFSHVGIYIGDNKFIHAPRTGAHVRIEDMRLSYWQKRFDGARRAPTPAAQRTEH